MQLKSRLFWPYENTLKFSGNFRSLNNTFAVKSDETQITT